AVLAAHLAVTEPAITACSGSPPKELSDARDKCRAEIEKTRVLLQAYESTIGSQAHSAEGQFSASAYGDSIGIVKELAEACSNAATPPPRPRTDLASRTADTCDAILTIAATQHPYASPADPTYAPDGTDDQTPNVPTAGPEHASYGADDQRPDVPAAEPAH